MVLAIGETAREVLPSNYTYEFGGISREESKTTNNATLIFLLCMVLVYLILCALYESVFIPFAVLLSVPCGLMGSFLFAWLFGLENNIYMQTGLIMIIGLLAKTAILLTEYAGKRRSEGMTLAQAAYSAAKVANRNNACADEFLGFLLSPQAQADIAKSNVMLPVVETNIESHIDALNSRAKSMRILDTTTVTSEQLKGWINQWQKALSK